MIWNEVEMIDVRRFHQRDIMGFAEVVEDTHHIYDRRWRIKPLRVASNLGQSCSVRW